MKIISKFKDYYDNISHRYLDPEILYIRKSDAQILTRVQKKELGPLHLLKYELKVGNEKLQVSDAILGFCGKLFPIVLVRNIIGQRRPVACFYSFDELYRYFLAHNLIVDEGTRRLTVEQRAIRHQLDSSKRFFKTEDKFKAIVGLFEWHQVPVFLLERTEGLDIEMTTNPILSNFGFQRICDPFSAHQELYQFISARLHQPERPMVQLSDRDKIHKHGFDKFSFRKGPGKKNRKS